MLTEKGLLLREGTTVDATLIAAPPSTKNREGKRDPEMTQTKKGNQWHFGMKAHIGVDDQSGLVHTFVGTTAKTSDMSQFSQLLHGEEVRVSADRGYDYLQVHEHLVVGPQGVDEPVTVNALTPVIAPIQDPFLLKALGRGCFWQFLLDTGSAVDTAEIAEREGLHKTFINDHLRLALLAPDIINAALRGTLPRTLTLLGLLRDGFPNCWQEQRTLIIG